MEWIQKSDKVGCGQTLESLKLAVQTVLQADSDRRYEFFNDYSLIVLGLYVNYISRYVFTNCHWFDKLPH